jgi:hypothetical protein
VTVCVVGCYGMRAVYCDRLCVDSLLVIYLPYQNVWSKLKKKADVLFIRNWLRPINFYMFRACILPIIRRYLRICTTIGSITIT